MKASITDPQKRTELQAVYTAAAHYGRRPNPIGWLQPKKNVIAIQRLWELIPECYPEDPTDWQLARLRHLIGLPVEHEWTQEDWWQENNEWQSGEEQNLGIHQGNEDYVWDVIPAVGPFYAPRGSVETALRA